jgi:hypothetical protein
MQRLIGLVLADSDSEMQRFESSRPHSELTPLVDRGKRIPRCQGDQLFTPAVEERISGDEQC